MTVRYVTVASEREQQFLIDSLNTNRFITAVAWTGRSGRGDEQLQVKITT